MWHVYWHTFPINAPQVIWAYGPLVAFEGHTGCRHILCNSMVNYSKSFFLLLMDMCSNVGSVCILQV